MLCGETTGAAFAVYNRLEHGMLVALGMWNAPPGFNPKTKPEGRICNDVIQKGGDDIFIVQDLPASSYATTDLLIAKRDLKTYIGMPIKRGGGCAGNLGLFYRDIFSPSEEDRQFIGVVSAIAGIEEDRHRDAAECKQAAVECKQFSGQLLHMRENDKAQFVSLLHDEIGSLTVGIAASCALAEEEMHRNSTALALNRLKKIKRLVRELTAKLKDISVDIRPPALEVSGVIGALHELIFKISSSSALKIDFDIDLPHEDRIPAPVKMVIYRVVQASLNNVLRHAKADKATIVLNCADGKPTLSIADAGRGFNAGEMLPEKPGKPKLGLRIMREQVESVGGTLSIDSKPDSGTVIKAEFSSYAD